MRTFTDILPSNVNTGVLGLDLQEEKRLVAIVHALVCARCDGLRPSTIFVPFKRVTVQVFLNTQNFENERFTFEKVELSHLRFTTLQH